MVLLRAFVCVDLRLCVYSFKKRQGLLFALPGQFARDICYCLSNAKVCCLPYQVNLHVTYVIVCQTARHFLKTYFFKHDILYFKVYFM